MSDEKSYHGEEKFSERDRRNALFLYAEARRRTLEEVRRNLEQNRREVIKATQFARKRGDEEPYEEALSLACKLYSEGNSPDDLRVGEVTEDYAADAADIIGMDPTMKELELILEGICKDDMTWVESAQEVYNREELPLGLRVEF